MKALNEEADMIHPELLKRVEAAHNLMNSCMATSLAGCFLIVGAELQGADARSAMYALVASIPLLGIHHIVTTPGHERWHHVSVLMQAMTLLGLLAMSVGLGFLFERGAPGAGVLFAVGVFLCATICMQSNQRAIAKTRKEATMKIAP